MSQPVFLCAPHHDDIHPYYHHEPRFLCSCVLSSGIYNLSPKWHTHRPWSSLQLYVQSKERLLYILLQLHCLAPYFSARNTLEPSVDWTVPGRIPNRLISWVVLVYNQHTVTRDLTMNVVGRKP